MVNKIKELSDKQNFNTFIKKKINSYVKNDHYNINDLVLYVMEKVEIYFSKYKKYGSNKKEIVIQIINQLTKIEIELISNTIEFIIDQKIIKNINKVIKFIKRHLLKKDIKNFLLKTQVIL